MIPLTTTIVNIINIINLTVDYNLINIITRKNNQFTIKTKNNQITIKTKNNQFTIKITMLLVHVINIDKRLTILITNNSIREWCIMIDSSINISNLINNINRRAWCNC